VIYYTVQTPDIRARAEGSFSFLQYNLTRYPDVRFVYMNDLLNKRDFESLEHFYDDGMERIGGRLMDEIVKARDDAAWRRRVKEGATAGGNS
jgi:hypothetical protein